MRNKSNIKYTSCLEVMYVQGHRNALKKLDSKLIKLKLVCGHRVVEKNEQADSIIKQGCSTLRVAKPKTDLPELKQLNTGENNM